MDLETGASGGESGEGLLHCHMQVCCIDWHTLQKAFDGDMLLTVLQDEEMKEYVVRSTTLLHVYLLFSPTPAPLFSSRSSSSLLFLL